jgi:hypothetical protein
MFDRSKLTIPPYRPEPPCKDAGREDCSSKSYWNGGIADQICVEASDGSGEVIGKGEEKKSGESKEEENKRKKQGKAGKSRSSGRLGWGTTLTPG